MVSNKIGVTPFYVTPFYAFYELTKPVKLFKIRSEPIGRWHRLYWLSILMLIEEKREIRYVRD